MCLDELAARCDIVAHEGAEDFVGANHWPYYILGVLNGDLQQRAPLGVHRDDMSVPQDQIGPLSVPVHVCLAQALIDDGALNLGQGSALVSKLDMIDRQLADRNIEAAAELFHAFIDQVQTFVGVGTLTVAQGPPLIDVAQNAID